MNHAARTFVFVGLVIILLLALHLLPTIYVFGTELRQVNILSDILPEVYRQKYAIDVIPKPAPPRQILVSDSTADTPPVDVYHPDGVTMIDDYGLGHQGGMDHFYAMLQQRDSLKRPVRIAYFGDSFIEGDILTAHLRQRLQEHFGGCGAGWVDPGNKINGFRRTVIQRFRHFDEYEVVSHPFSHKVQGINQRYFVPQEGASVWTRGTDYCPLTSQWQRSILYLRASEGTEVSVCVNDRKSEWRSFRIGPSAHVQHLNTPCDSTTTISYRFSSVGNDTFIYGMALEGSHGVTLDNFSMRGSSGTTLLKIPLDVLKDFATMRPYDLIVLHYGLNVVSDRSHAANYKNYIKKMRRVVDHLQQAYPKASFLIVSVPDRDQRTPAGVRTMNGVEALSAYQQIMADSQHVAYFNLFKAMGGRESMEKLVRRQLANKDYTHLSHGGGKVVSDYLYKSIAAGYENYRRRHP